MTTEPNLTCEPEHVQLQKALDTVRLMYRSAKGMSPWDVAKLSAAGQRARREALERLESEGKTLAAKLEQLKTTEENHAQA